MKFKGTKKELGLVSEGFEISVILKGIDGVLEIIGGLVLLFVPIEKINTLTAFLTRKELIDDPKDFIANYLVHTANSLTISSVKFTVLFLLTHGLIKLFLVVMLLKKKLWAYPLAMIVFGLFGLYQIYQIALTGSIGLVILTILDVVVVSLTWFEYMILKKKLKVS